MPIHAHFFKILVKLRSGANFTEEKKNIVQLTQRANDGCEKKSSESAMKNVTKTKTY